MEGHKNTVLFVDDEVQILSAIRRATIDEPFNSIFASSGNEALQSLAEHDVSVIVTDMRMPGMDGLMLLKAVREKYPKTVRIVLSGYTQLSQVLATVNQGDIFQFIPKPWQMEEELLTAIRQALDHYNLEVERDQLREGLAKKNQAYQNILRTMEQKMANERKDLVNLKRINHWTFSFLKKQLQMNDTYLMENKAAITDYIQLIEEFQLVYLAILPTFTEEKSLEKIITDLTQACTDHIVINRKTDTEPVLTGYHEFFVMTVKTIIYLIAADTKEQILCDIATNVTGSEPPLVFLDIGLGFCKWTAIEQNKLKIGCSLLNEMGKAYSVKVLLDATEGNVSVRVILGG